jgi:predicted RND superfamily exporter protein
MIWWILILLVLFILSYLSQVGTLFLLQIKFPFFTSSLINILILVCMAIVIFRILSRMKKGEKENLKKRIRELEAELKALKQEGSISNPEIRRDEEENKEPEAKEEET